jgi:hypothetical protein
MTRTLLAAIAMLGLAGGASAQDRSPATDFDMYGRLKTPPVWGEAVKLPPGHMVCHNEPAEAFHSGATPLVRRCYLVPNPNHR